MWNVKFVVVFWLAASLCYKVIAMGYLFDSAEMNKYVNFYKLTTNDNNTNYIHRCTFSDDLVNNIIIRTVLIAILFSLQRPDTAAGLELLNLKMFNFPCNLLCTALKHKSQDCL